MNDISKQVLWFIDNNKIIDTLDLIKKNEFPETNIDELNLYYVRYIKPMLLELNGLMFYDDIKIAVESGYNDITHGNLRSGEESNRFIIERGCLSIFIKGTTLKYKEALDNMDWHHLVDDGNIIRSFGEAINKIRKVDNKINFINGKTIFLCGKAVCDKHDKYMHYSMPIKTLTNKSLRCYCGKEAEYFVLPMPKVNALIGLSCYIANVNSMPLNKVYSNVSRIIHPYGFSDFDVNNGMLLWLKDLKLILSVIISMKDSTNL